ncbi:MAG: arylsulfatase [Bacteroidota bacterium]
MLLRLLLLLSLLISACQPGTESSEADSKPDHPHIVYILADDLGWGDISAQNPESKISTPNIDQLAREGIRFTDMHTPSSVCTPTRYGILTGEYAWRSRLKRGVLFGYDLPLIPEDKLTIADLMQRNGYYTAGVGKWHLGLPFVVREDSDYLQRHQDSITTLGTSEDVDIFKAFEIGGPTDLGFDEYFGIPASLDMAPYGYIKNNQWEVPPTDSIAGEVRSPDYDKGFWRGGEASPDFDHRQVLPKITKRAVQIISEHGQARADQPLFLYFPLNAPHTPWLPTEEFRGKSQAGKYGDFVVMVDDVVGKVMQALEEQSMTENTLIILTSDNGSHIDHIGKEYQHTANANWRGQKADIHEGGHRVPFVARWPKRVPANQISNALGCLTDLMATAAAITKDSLANEVGVDSYNLLPVMLGEQQESSREAVVHHSLDGMFSVRKGDWKLVLGRGTGGFTQPRREEVEEGEPAGQLYNLAEDPSEQNDLYAEESEKVEELRSMLVGYKTEGRSRQ